MNTCTDLIPRNELVEDCCGTGRQIESEVLKRKRVSETTGSSYQLPDSELEVLVEPLVDKIIERTKRATDREAEEERARIRDQYRESERQREWEATKAQILETRHVTINAVSPLGIGYDKEPYYSSNDLGVEVDDCTLEEHEQTVKVVPGVVLSIEETVPYRDIDECTIDNMYDDDWTDYHPGLLIRIAEPFAKYYRCSAGKMLKMATEDANGDPDKFIYILRSVRDAGLMEYTYQNCFIWGAESMYNFFKNNAVGSKRQKTE